MRIARAYNIFAATFLVGAALVLSGCQAIHPGWSSLAFVEVKGVPLDRVREAAIQVFTSEHYEVQSANNRQELVFCREGTLNDRLQYARYQESLEMRVEVTLEPFGQDGVLVRADAFAVFSESGRSEVRVLRIARRPYRRLLDRVKDLAQSEPEQGDF